MQYNDCNRTGSEGEEQDALLRTLPGRGDDAHGARDEKGADHEQPSRRADENARQTCCQLTAEPGRGEPLTQRPEAEVMPGVERQGGERQGHERDEASTSP